MSAGAPRTSSSTCGLGRGVVAALRSAGVVALGVLAALGALTAPQAALLLGAVFAALGWGFVRALHHGRASDLVSLPHPSSAAACTALLPAGAAGTAALGLGPLGVAGATIAVAVAIGWWGGSCGDPQPRQAERDAGPEPDDGSLRDLLGVVPVEVLFEEWRGTAEPVVLGGVDAGTRSRLRCLLIAELRRRDPVGTQRWLTQAPEAPPDGYVQDAPDRTA
ncbi:hypothetical protein [Geodermatophilus chilensis]|uniref:hypothetical protein n=1 Tax=Geodermatophilus chilensis TaxID=2035835 RepID=UPI000C264324|nr:hypothetical protein [Geodermatophilus chilensis]